MSNTPNRPFRPSWRVATTGAIAGVMLGGFAFASASDGAPRPAVPEVQPSNTILGSPSTVTVDSTVLAQPTVADLISSVDVTAAVTESNVASAISVSVPSPVSVASVASVASPASVASVASVASPASVASVASVSSPASVD